MRVRHDIPSSHIKLLQETPRNPIITNAYTGNSSPPPPETPNFLNATLIQGPTTGTFPKNPATVAKKSPNKIMIPYNSTKNPTRGQRNRIKRIPIVKANVPRSFWRRAKKERVFEGPRIRGRPIRKRMLPIARRERSKKVRRPRVRKNVPGLGC